MKDNIYLVIAIKDKVAMFIWLLFDRIYFLE